MPTPIVVAHRGLHGTAAENSVAAFVAAAEAKMAWAECDVWSSADGVPVVIHDQTLERTTAGIGPVSDHTWLELQQLGVPSLKEVLAALTDQTGLLVEIKPAGAGRLVAAVRESLQPFKGPWMLQSFHFENVDFSERCAVLVEEHGQLKLALDGPWQSVHVEHSMIDLGLIDRLHAQGRRIGAWTVNHPCDIQRMIDLHIDLLITDEPELAASLISKR